MLALFRLTSLCEGISFLAILSVSLGLISRQYVYPIGMGHGILFMTYLVLSLVIAAKLKWSLKIWLPVFLASVVPFAFLAVEFYLRKSSTEGNAEAT
jgi:integral membrane protein